MHWCISRVSSQVRIALGKRMHGTDNFLGIFLCILEKSNCQHGHWSFLSHEDLHVPVSSAVNPRSSMHQMSGDMQKDNQKDVFNCIRLIYYFWWSRRKWDLGCLPCVKTKTKEQNKHQKKSWNVSWHSFCLDQQAFICYHSLPHKLGNVPLKNNVVRVDVVEKKVFGLETLLQVQRTGTRPPWGCCP